MDYSQFMFIVYAKSVWIHIIIYIYIQVYIYIYTYSQFINVAYMTSSYSRWTDHPIIQRSPNPKRRSLGDHQELWYLIGIQADITGLSKWNVPEDADDCTWRCSKGIGTWGLFGKNIGKPQENPRKMLVSWEKSQEHAGLKGFYGGFLGIQGIYLLVMSKQL